MNIIYRLEDKKDWYIVEKITREAFWQKDEAKKNKIGCDEHYLAHCLRKSDCFIPELDFVAELNGEVIGNIMYTKAWIETADGQKHETICLGPVSVLPKFQNKGIGANLIEFSIQKAKELGYETIFLYGHPNYYPRFGFQNASKYNITTKDGKNFPAFMVLELTKNALKNISGKFIMDSVFDIDGKAALKFDRKFSSK